MSYQQEPEMKHRSSTKERILVSVFIALYLVIAMVQSVPTSRLPRNIAQISEPLIAITGTKQRWNLFAPELMQTNQFSSVLIINNAGNMQLYEWPRLDLMDSGKKFELQQTRRFVTECLARPQYSYFWPPVSERFIRRFSSPGEPIEQVNFRFNFAPVPDFKNYTFRENLPRAYSCDTTFAYFNQPKEK